MPEEDKTYIGDGVYAEFDGYQIVLTVPEPGIPDAICLEPKVCVELVEYMRRHKCIPDFIKVKE